MRFLLYLISFGPLVVVALAGDWVATGIVAALWFMLAAHGARCVRWQRERALREILETGDDWPACRESGRSTGVAARRHGLSSYGGAGNPGPYCSVLGRRR